jgi:4-amino-4-deoxy-L-arabinose transferase-like glycosyltransferase
MKHENSDNGKVGHRCVPQQPRVDRPAARRKLLILGLIFLTTLGVRLLNWHDSHNEVSAVQTSVTLNYKHQARLIRANGLASLYDASSSTSNPDLLGHPLGYPILLSLIYRVAPESDTATQLVQIILDSLAAVIICLIAFELFPTPVAVVAGLMAAFAPQFSWNSILLLPDSLAALPILLAVLLILRTRHLPSTRAGGAGTRHQSKRLLLILAAGALIGVSCWLRANALLLAPFLALLFPIIYKRGERLRLALVLVGSACLVIAPLTIRNAMVSGKFIPLSLGAGQTLIEGIADYNVDGSLGLPQTDMELIRGEAKTFQRPDYANSLFTPDGPARDRARLARGLAVIRAHPFWFSGVMVRRAFSMLRLERTPLRLAPATPVTWQHLIQSPLRILQKLFITAIFLPLVLIGAGILIYERQLKTLAFLLVVPCYYFCTQSALHTEYRYVLVIHYFLFVLAAVAIYSITCQVSRMFNGGKVE